MTWEAAVRLRPVPAAFRERMKNLAFGSVWKRSTMSFLSRREQPPWRNIGRSPSLLSRKSASLSPMLLNWVKIRAFSRLAWMLSARSRRRSALPERAGSQLSSLVKRAGWLQISFRARIICRTRPWRLKREALSPSFCSLMTRRLSSTVW
ncbi:Uncharacterised protein [Bacteroides xylanisolvens]|nr:Uncharacterised protein [Bacteroides xylanisolvens]